MYSMLEMGDPMINFSLNRPNYALSKDIEKNKSFPDLKQMVVKAKNVDKMCYENFFCVAYSYDKSSVDDYGLCLMEIQQKQIILKLEHRKQF